MFGFNDMFGNRYSTEDLMIMINVILNIIIDKQIITKKEYDEYFSKEYQTKIKNALDETAKNKAEDLKKEEE